MPESRVRRFGPFELDLSSGELWKDGTRVALQEQPLQVLVVLTERPGELITRDELRQRLWPADTYVDFEHGLNAAVKRLRDSLGDSADDPRLVETVPRRGYRFIAPIDLESGTTVSAPDTSPASGRKWPGRFLAASLGVLALVTAGLLVTRGLRPQGPRVTGYSQVTRQEVQFPPFPSEFPLLTDGPRIYFTEWVNGLLFARQVASSGGETVRLPLSPGDHHIVEAVSPDGSELLVAAPTQEEASLGEAPFWLVPIVGGTPRRLGDVRGHAAAWLPDGRILYAMGNDLYFVASDGSRRQKLMTLPSRPYWPPCASDPRSWPKRSTSLCSSPWVRCSSGGRSRVVTETGFLQSAGT